MREKRTQWIKTGYNIAMKYEQMMPGDKKLESLWHPGETKRPYGYFAAQAEFALKALSLGLAETVPQALEKFTALPRKIMGNKNPVKADGSHWMETVKVLQKSTNVETPTELADQLFAKYLSYPEVSLYGKPALETFNGRQVGAFTHDFDAEAQAIRLHFVERIRGSKSEFGEQDMADRRLDMENLTRLIKEKNYQPNPTIVTSGSWMYNYRTISHVMPDSFRESAGPPPKMTFGGDSLWGQFVTSDGGYHAERYRSFSEKLKVASDLPSMIEAFPMPVLFLQAPLEDFYRQYNI